MGGKGYNGPLLKAVACELGMGQIFTASVCLKIPQEAGKYKKGCVFRECI